MRGYAALIAGLAIVASACGGGGDAGTTAASSAPPPATAAVAEEPFGEYSREVAEDEIVATPGEEPLATGRWRLTLGPSIIQVTDASGFRIAQELSVEGDALEVERYLGGDGIFCEDDAASSYRWDLEGGTLTLTPENDDCPDRRAVLGATWEKAS